MVSEKLIKIYLISLFLIIGHMLEEWLTGFHNIFPFVLSLANYFKTPQAAVFGTFMLMSWLLLFVVLGMISGRKWTLIILSLFSVIYVFELHHPIRAIILGKYYPGAVTGIAFPILGVFFWRELIANWRRKIK